MHIHNAVMMSNHYVEQANLKRFPIETFSLVHFLLNTSFESFLTYQIPFIPSPIINFIEQKSRIRDNQSEITKARFARVTQNSLRDFCLPGNLDGDFAPHSLGQCTFSNMQIGSYKNSRSVIVSITENQKHFLYKTFPYTILQLAYLYIYH